mgnify:CR=1 FL=1
MNKEYFIEENKVDTKSFYSESKKYRIEISQYKTKEGCWNYSGAEIFNEKSEKIETVYRNHASFYYTFIEDHGNGHDYILCGENYQGQTVIELDTGIRKDYLPDSASKGVAFCHTTYKYSEDKTKLIANGCFWGGPYENFVYDFSNPLDLPYKRISESYYEVINSITDEEHEPFFCCNIPMIYDIKYANSSGKMYYFDHNSNEQINEGWTKEEIESFYKNDYFNSEEGHKKFRFILEAKLMK